MVKPLVKPEFYTYADYYAWPDSIRGELIAGEFYDMTPAPSTAHQDIAGNLYAQLLSFFRKTPYRVFIAPFDVRLPEPGQEEGSERDVVQPDVVVCERSKVDERGCRGAPHWVIEVLSPRTKKRDMQLKRDLYEHHRVPLYWIVAPLERSFTALHLGPDGPYVSSGSVTPKGRLAVPEYPGLEIDWDWVFSE